MAGTVRQGDGAAASGRVAGRLGTVEPSLAPPTRRARLPELALGLVLMVLFAIAGTLWHLRSVDRVPALAVAAPVARGEVIEAADLQVVHVASDEALARIDRSEADRVLGKVALVDLEPGVLVTDAVVADADRVIGRSEGVVGLPLDPGAYPVFDIAVGDRVNVVQVGATAPPASAGDPTSEDGESDEDETGGSDTAERAGSVGGQAVASNAEVIAVQDMAGGERKLVSLRVPVTDAERIASLDWGSLHLVQVGQ